MPAIWQRHPRFVCLTIVVVCALFFTLNSSFSEISSLVVLDDPGLPDRLARSGRIYDKVLRDRKQLIKKFGPTPSDIDLFPPNQSPWPAYTVWDFFPAAYNCPHELVRTGALGDGGKWVCGLSRVVHKRDCVVYSVGINTESSFEAEVLTSTKYCKVWGFDYSVKGFGRQISLSQSNRVFFKPYLLGKDDKHGPTDNPKAYTLRSVMEENGHSYIDILKVDIEGWEFDALTAFIQPYLDSDTPLPFGQLQLEIHLWKDSKHSFARFLEWWEMLEAAGLRPFMTEPNMVYVNYNKGLSSELAECSFLNIKGENIFTHDPRPLGAS
ncbi:hypothetical protein HGRIS_006172 [Hohenbuehelia grisea]|uniref:Methyltransferase domain-containing protein n=1 Tax=Hohenbuehelia grisea TaxID=104357 RepID=A0ABR3JZ55_9AGAR